jgi:hypothetical protein
MILLSGGATDPNMTALRDRLKARGVDHLDALGGEAGWHLLTWNMADDRLEVDGRAVRPEALFVRFDVFARSPDGEAERRRRAAEWYYAVLSWALAHEEARMFNRGYGTRHAAKPHILMLAHQAGLELAETVVTNDPAALDGLDADGWIVKPVNGGSYTETLRAMCGDPARLEGFTRTPTFLQRRLSAPDMRIFRVGGRWFAFELEAAALDYRAARDVRIAPVPPDPALVRRLAALTDGLGLDFAAADFKLCPESGRFSFLEVNSAPMYATFDACAQGAIVDAMIDWMIP